MISGIANLYHNFEINPTSANHIKLASPLYTYITKQPMTATIEHVVERVPQPIWASCRLLAFLFNKKYDPEQDEFNAVYDPYKNTCILKQKEPNEMIISLGHELGHAYHGRLLPTTWEEEKTVLFETLYTRTLEEMLDRDLGHRLPQSSLWHPYINTLAKLPSTTLMQMYRNFDNTVEEFELPLRKPLVYKLGF